MILSELNRLLVNVANSNYLVNDAFVGDVYTINGKENRFGCFVATPMKAVKYVTGTIRYTYVMYYIDRLTKDEANIDFVQSDAVSVLKGILNFIGGQGIEVEDGYEFTLFRQKFSDWCAGAYVEVDITVADDDCGEDDFNTAGIELKPLAVTSNGIYEAGINAGFNIVTVSVPQSGGVTPEWVDNEIDLKLTGYATESWVQSQGYLTSVVLDGYATQSWVESQGYLTSVPAGYATETFVTTALSSAMSGITSDLSSYATQNWVSSQQFATETWVVNQGYLTSVSMSDYVTMSWISSQNFVTSESLTGYATQSWVNDQHFLTSVVLDGYATESWVQSQGYLTTVVLDGYATQSWVSSNFLSTTALTGYATQSWVQSQGYLTEHQDLSSYATKSWATSEFFEESKIWTGTTAQWNDLTSAQKATYTIALITE